MRFIAVFVVWLLCGTLLHAVSYCYEKDGKLYNLYNTHLYGTLKNIHLHEHVLAAVSRDIVLIPVKNPSNCIFSNKNPSFMHKERKIIMKFDGKIFQGSILEVSEKHFTIDIKSRRGSSGIPVMDADNKSLYGLLSHIVENAAAGKSVVVRTDNLHEEKFEKIKASDFMRDWKYFSMVKEREYLLLDGLKKASDDIQFKSFLLKNPPAFPEKYNDWKSTYLRNQTLQSLKNIDKLTGLAVF